MSQYTTRKCEVCGEDISHKPSQRRTCGTKCGRILINRANTKPPEFRECAVCGKTFKAKYQKSPIRVCSRSCAGVLRVRNKPARSAIPQHESNTYRIPMNKGFYAIVDACDVELAVVNWTAAVDKRRSLVYARRIIYERGVAISRESLHRKVMERVLGRQLDKTEMIDHENGDGLDCRRSNIRLASAIQNGWNRRLFSNSTSGYKGVSWDKKCKKWRAKIYPNGRQIQLGLYDDPVEAHNAYKAAAKLYFGEFANDGNGGYE